MSGINPIHGAAPPVPAQPSQPSQPTGAAREAKGQADGFGSAVRELIEKVDGDQQTSAVAIEDLISGGGQDVVSVVSQVARADMSFKLLIGVRNKIIEAYKQTMNMQV